MKKTILILTAFFMVFACQAQDAAEECAKTGQEKLEQGNYKGAIKYFTKAIKLVPDYDFLYKSYYGRGYAKFMIGDFKGANLDFGKAIKIYPNNPDVYFWRAYTKYKLKKKPGSEIVDYDRAILLKPNYPEAFFNRGWSKWDLGKKDQACMDWQEAFNLGYLEAEKPLKDHCGF